MDDIEYCKLLEKLNRELNNWCIENKTSIVSRI